MKKVIYSSSFIEFLRNSDCKVAKFLYRLNRKRYSPNLLTIDEINFLTFRKDGTISYLPSGKEIVYNTDGEWSKEGRQNGKPSKVIRKIFSQRALSMFKDADFECFTNAYKANFNDAGYTFELLQSSEIPGVYDMDRATGEGSLNNSCMNGDTDYLDIYKKCKVLQILTLKDTNGLLCGRSLVWKISDTITLMDRVYVSQDFMYDMFITHAKKADYWHKKDYRSYDNKTTFIMPCGKESENTFIINTDTDFSYYPYIDTFQYGGDGFLTNEDNSTYTYNNTDGSRDGDDEEDEHEGEVYDDVNDEWISEDDSCYIEEGESRYRGRTCHYDYCVMVGDSYYHLDDSNICQVNGNYYTTDDSDICEIDGDYHLLEDCIYCERDSQYYLSEDCVYCEDDEEDVLSSEAIEIDGKWYHEESEKITKIDGEYYLIDSDEVECINGVYSLIEIAEETN